MLGKGWTQPNFLPELFSLPWNEVGKDLGFLFPICAQFGLFLTCVCCTSVLTANPELHSGWHWSLCCQASEGCRGIQTAQPKEEREEEQEERPSRYSAEARTGGECGGTGWEASAPKARSVQPCLSLQNTTGEVLLDSRDLVQRFDFSQSIDFQWLLPACQQECHPERDTLIKLSFSPRSHWRGNADSSSKTPKRGWVHRLLPENQTGF